jgi:hypothetical protein
MHPSRRRRHYFLAGELDTMAAFPSEAERLQRAMVARRTAELGPDHVSTLRGSLKLAQTLKRASDSELLTEAKVLLQRCIGGFEEIEVIKNALLLTAAGPQP